MLTCQCKDVETKRGFVGDFICSKLMTLLGSKISGALENDSFAVSFMHLELRKGTGKAGGSKTDTGL